jgi:hypothetical protein
MKKAQKKLDIPKDIERQIYLDNRASMIEQFREALMEEKNSFITRSIFIAIFEQEDFILYISETPHKFATVKEEKEILNLLTKEAKEVYGKEYDGLYQELKKGRTT